MSGTQLPITSELTDRLQDTAGILHVIFRYEQFCNGPELDDSVATNPHDGYVAFNIEILSFST